MGRKRTTQKSLRRGLIEEIYNSAPMPQPAQPDYTPSFNSGMSRDEIANIYNSYTPETQEIPKLENTTPTTPSISDELERMKKAKADTTTPRTEGEQKAIDTYYDSLMKASGQTPTTSAPKTDYKAEIDRMNAIKADTTTPRTEGENRAIETYLNSLVDAQRYLDSQKPITKPSVKTSSSEKKVTKKNVKNIGTVEIKADGTKNYTKTMSANEQRDYERALLAQSKARGRALSPNEQRDLERAQNAIAQAKEREKVTEESVNKVMPTSAKENTEELQFGQLRQKPKATPKPGDFKETTQEIMESKTEEKPESNIIPELGKNYALQNPGVKPRTTMETIRDLAVNVTDKGAATPESVLWNYNIPSDQWKEIDKDLSNYNVWRGSQSDLANQGNFIASLASSNISKKLQDKYGLDEQTLNQLANDYKNTKSTYEGVQKERTAQNIGANHPIGGSIISLGSGALGSVLTPTQLADDLTNYVYNGQQTSPYEGAHLLSQTKDAYREGVKENIDSGLGKGIYDVAMGVGDMGVATIPSLLGAPVSPALGLALETANSASTSALERGNNPIQATAYGVGSGALDYTLNRIGLDKAKDLALDSIKASGIRKFLTQNLIAGGVEAGENILQDIGQTALDELINNKNSEMRYSYAQKLASGETEEQALKEVIADKAKQIAISVGTGFAMGSTMQGGSTLLNDLYSNIIINDIDKNSQRVWNRVNEYKNSLNPLETVARNADIDNAVNQQREAIRQIEALNNNIPRISMNDIDAQEQAILEQMAKYRKGEMPTNELINMGETQRYLSDFGNVDNDVLLKQSKFKQLTAPFNKKKHQHGLSDEEVAGYVRDANSPIAVYASPSDPASPVIVGNRIDANGNPIVSSLNMDVPLGRETNNLLSSEYRKNVGDQLYHAREEGRMKFENREKVDKLISDRRHRAPKSDSSLDLLSNSKINQIDESVNPSKITNNDVIPKVEETDITSGNIKQRRVITNSAQNADIITDADIDADPELQRIRDYEEHSNVRTYKQAQRDVADNRAQLEQDYIDGNRAINTDLDVDRGMIILKDIAREIESGNDVNANTIKRNAILRNMATNGTEAGQFIQAFAKYANTAEDALVKATKLDVDNTERWKSRNKKAYERNSRIAKALEELGHKPETSKERIPLTHEQLKKNVQAELEREMGSISDKFSDADLEYLTILAENKNIPVWQITSEIEHKLQTGDWYSLDETIEPPSPGSRKLQNALNRLAIDDEKSVPERKSFDQVREEVQNTINKEMAGVDNFTSDDVNYLANLMEQGATSQEITDALNTRLATGKWGISDESLTKVNDIFDAIRHYDENSKEFVEGQAEAFRILAEEVAPKASAMEKFDAWRYMAMLGNPKTMLRNYVGNKMFGAVVGASNTLSAALEGAIDSAYYKRTGNHIQRQKAVLTPFGADKNLIKASKEDGFGKRFRQFEGSKYEKSTKDAILQQRSVYDTKAMRLLEKAVDSGISDTNAVAKKYSTSLAGYLKANGYDASVFDLQNEYDSLKQAQRFRELLPEEKARVDELKPTIDFLEKARDYAVDQAEYATFHEDNAFADWLSKTARTAPGWGRYLIEGTIPFKKTPANILRSGFEYSPFGALKSIKETGKLIYENTGSRKGNLEDTYSKKSKLTGKDITVNKSLASDVIDSWSKTLTGSALAGLGYFLFNKGILTSSTKDEKYQDQLEGIGNYAININGHTYTLDWAAPGVMPLLVGAEINKVLKNNDVTDKEWYENPDQWLSTINAILDPMFETSMLSGIKDTLQTAANEVRFNEDNAVGGILGSMAGNALTGYLTQAIPTLSGQIARTVDPVRRTTDTVNEGILGTIEKQGRKIANKIPFLSRINPEYRDAYGRGQNNSPFNGNNAWETLGNLGYQMLSPGYYSKVNTTAADTISRNAYNAMDDNTENPLPIRDSKVFANWAASKKINGEKLNPEQMQTYREIMGKANYDLRTALSDNEWFNGLSGTKQTEILKSLNTLSDKIGQYAVAPDSLDPSGSFKVYLEAGGGEKGIEAVISDLQGKSLKKDAGVTSNSNVGKAIQEAVEKGDTETAERIVESTKALSDYGLDKPAPAYTYEKARTVIPSLTVEEFATTYKKIDSDNNQSVKQAEVITYLNSGSYTQSQGDQIWNAYGSSNWKKIPKLESGTWKLASK